VDGRRGGGELGDLGVDLLVGERAILGGEDGAPGEVFSPGPRGVPR